MTGYIGVTTNTNPDDLSREALEFLVANIPGFVPRNGHLEVWLVMALARMVAEARDVASAVPTTIFRFFGRSLLGLVPVDAASATVTTTWTMANNAGFTIPAGTAAGFRTTGDEVVPFVTLAPIVVPPGSTQAVGVTMEAIDVGDAENGLGPGAMELIDALAFVASVVATDASVGGVDAETDEEYLDRLAEELRLLTPRPILPRDFAILSRRVPGVHRALAIDGYNPGDSTYNNERMVTVAVVDEDGAVVGAGIKADVDAMLEASREVNFIVHVIDPTFTVIDVSFDVAPTEGSDPAIVRDAVIAALTDYLSPGMWAGGAQTPPEWRNEPIIRYLELASVVNAVPGVDYIRTLTVEGGTVNVNLGGAAPLPQPGVINGVVTA